jgi:hypothetical protein
LATDLHRQGIAQVLGRRRRLEFAEFKSIEYKRKGDAVAMDEQLKRITQMPKREFMRRGINQHTLQRICKRQPVRVVKLAKRLKALEQTIDPRPE